MKKLGSCSDAKPCNQWHCNICAHKKLFWLRENAINFARALASQTTYFTTVKGVLAIENALDRLRSYTPVKKRANARYNAKKEHFFVIAKHNRSDWHMHIISNYPLEIEGSHVEIVRDRKAVVLYFVKNLEISRFADYGKKRRYGGSSLLYKQSAKNWYKTRIRLFKIRTLIGFAETILRYLASFQGSRQPDKPQHMTAARQPITDTQKSALPNKTRPPPIWDKLLIIVKHFTPLSIQKGDNRLIPFMEFKSC